MLNCLVPQEVLMHAGVNRKKTDQMLELQNELFTQLEDLRNEKEKEKRAVERSRARKTIT